MAKGKEFRTSAFKLKKIIFDNYIKINIDFVSHTNMRSGRNTECEIETFRDLKIVDASEIS